MSQGVRNTEELLILTCTPQDTITALEWRPFRQGNTLGEIITAHNLRCAGLLQQNTPQTFADCLPEIKPALTIGTCLAEDVGEESPNRLAKVKILLLDLDSGDPSQERLRTIRNQLAKWDRIFHFIQVSRSTRSVSWARFFGEKACILRSDPEVFLKQSDMEKFLHVFRQTYEDGWAGVIQNPLDAPCQEKSHNEPYIHPSRGHFLKPDSKQGKSVERVYRDYRKALPNLLNDIRDAAMARQLPEDQVVNLGRTAAIQELLLTLIGERARRYTGGPVSVSPIRLPIYAVPSTHPLEMRELQQIHLVVLQLMKPLRDLDDSQREVVTELGFSDGVSAAVYFDRPEIREEINKLENIVKSDDIEGELPGWPMRPEKCRVGFNEYSFGLNIEESLSKDMEVQYAQMSSETSVFAENDQS